MYKNLGSIGCTKIDKYEVCWGGGGSLEKIIYFGSIGNFGAHVFYIFHCLVRLQIIHKKVRENLVPVGEAGLKNISLVFGEKGTVCVIFYQLVSLDRN